MITENFHQSPQASLLSAIRVIAVHQCMLLIVTLGPHPGGKKGCFNQKIKENTIKVRIQNTKKTLSAIYNFFLHGLVHGVLQNTLHDRFLSTLEGNMLGHLKMAIRS